MISPLIGEPFLLFAEEIVGTRIGRIVPAGMSIPGVVDSLFSAWAFSEGECVAAKCVMRILLPAPGRGFAAKGMQCEIAAAKRIENPNDEKAMRFHEFMATSAKTLFCLRYVDLQSVSIISIGEQNQRRLGPPRRQVFELGLAQNVKKKAHQSAERCHSHVSRR